MIEFSMEDIKKTLKENGVEGCINMDAFEKQIEEFNKMLDKQADEFIEKLEQEFTKEIDKAKNKKPEKGIKKVKIDGKEVQVGCVAKYLTSPTSNESILCGALETLAIALNRVINDINNNINGGK